MTKGKIRNREIIDRFKEKVEGKEIVILSNGGLSVRAMQMLRTKARNKNTNVYLCKKSLANIGLKESGLNTISKGQYIFLISDDMIRSASVINDLPPILKRSIKIVSLIDKGGLIDNKATLESIKTITNKEAFIASIVSVFNHQVVNLILVLNQIIEQKS